MNKSNEQDQDIITLAIQGMYCAGCASRIENVLKRTEGIEDVKVNFATSTAIVKYNQKSLKYGDIYEKIKKLGYDATKKENLFAKERIEKLQKEKQKNKREILLFIFSLILSLPLLFSMFISYQIPFWIQFLLATPVQFLAGFRFHKGAIKTILGGGANMDVLVSLGTNVAYFYSVFVMIFPNKVMDSHVYFESSSVVITFVLLGKILEGITKRKAYQALEDLFSLQPLICHLWRNGEIIDIDLSEIQINDIIIVRPGENIPVDGIVIEGRSECNESLITGESLPVIKNKGDKVYSGTMNLSGMLKVQVKELPENSTLANILKMIEKAQNTKAPVQKLADIISGYFAYGVILISILTFIISYFIFNIDLSSSIIRSVSVLVIACPCALGLATPIAILISTGIAAKYGILFRNAETIENAGKINVLIFDKTGTLTTGKLKVVKTYFDKSLDIDLQKKVYSMIYLLESSSEHIIAKSISEFTKSIFSSIPIPDLELKHLENYPGYGIRGEILEKNTNRIWDVYIGNRDLFIEKFKNIDLLYNKDISEQKTAVYFAIPNLTKGIFLLEDTIREEAPKVIKQLKTYHIRPILATGDKKEIAESIAHLSGIEIIYYELKPEDKLSLIEKLQKDGFIVGMIGDGINDAPALAKADVSFAMGEGVSITKESADINLIHNDLTDISFSIYLSKITLRKIKQNLFFAFIYNTLGIPLAAMGYLSPVFAGFAMAMSSVSVVTSSLFLYLNNKESYIKKLDLS
ncbi:MAG: copper-translocating P-type ATPase [Leptospiraceae bacterium]|nr:MAG: copper-translocating P-type ATPase [Leptospiraceae bacterium]